MNEVLEITCSVADIENYFDVRLYETCAREAFDIGGFFYGRDHPNMLIIIQKHKHLVTGLWGLVPKETKIESIADHQDSRTLKDTLYTSLDSLFSRPENTDLRRCIVPVSCMDPEINLSMVTTGNSRITGLAGVYRKIGNMTVFSLLYTRQVKNVIEPIKLDALDSAHWLDHDHPIGHGVVNRT